MVRTKASNAAPAATRKAVAARAPRKSVGVSRPVSSPSPSGGRSKKGKSVVGGNPVKLWGTPEWQKGIGRFLKNDREDGCSSSVQNDDHQEPGPSNEQTEMETEDSNEPMTSTAAGGVAILDSSIVQLNSDDEDSN